MRFVIFGFLILGWAFWEMSGGADFEPRKQAMTTDMPATASVRSVPATTIQKPEPVRTAALVKPREVTRLSARRQPDPAPLPETPTPNLALSLAQPQMATDGAADSVQLASLADGNGAFPQPVFLDPAGTAPGDSSVASASRAIPDIEPALDIRDITGSRVNLRQGPGTTYAVVDTLFFDDRVEVLDDPGDGWIQLRHVENGQIGWMAARFVGRRPAD